MILRELKGRHWYGVKMWGSRRHRQFLLDSMIFSRDFHTGRASGYPIARQQHPIRSSIEKIAGTINILIAVSEHIASVLKRA